MRYKIVFKSPKNKRVKYSKKKSSGYGIYKPSADDFWYDSLNNKWLSEIPKDYSGWYISNRCDEPRMLSFKAVIRRIKNFKPKSGDEFFCGNSKYGSGFTLIVK